MLPSSLLSCSILSLLFTGCHAVTSAGCGTNKTCYFSTDNCALTSPTCYFVSWTKSSSGDTYDFEMSGSAGGGGSYIAFALGTVDRMENADLYYCDGNGVHSGVITTRAEPSYLNFTAEPGLKLISANTVGGVAGCSFSRAPSISRYLTSGTFYFDIVNTTFHLLVASGATKVGGIQRHTWRYVTPNKMNFSAMIGSTKTTSPVSTNVMFSTVKPEETTTGSSVTLKATKLILFLSVFLCTFL